MAKRQSAVYRRNVPSTQSELELAHEVRTRLGIDIDPKKLAKFICDRFTILSILCHEIHSAENQNELTQ